MNFHLSKNIRSNAALLAVCVLLSGCGLIKELIVIFSKPQPISGEVELNGSTTLHPPKPLKVIAKRQSVSIRTDAVDGFSGRAEEGILKFKNGRIGRVSGTLWDLEGKTYALKVVAIGGAEGGIYLSVPSTERADFPADARFDRIAIETEVPFRAHRVEWVAEIQK